MSTKRTAHALQCRSNRCALRLCRLCKFSVVKTQWAEYRTSLGVELAHPLKSWVSGNHGDDGVDAYGGDSRGSGRPARPRFNSALRDFLLVEQARLLSCELPPGTSVEEKTKSYRQTVTYWNYIHPEASFSLCHVT